MGQRWQSIRLQRAAQASHVCDRCAWRIVSVSDKSYESGLSYTVDFSSLAQFTAKFLAFKTAKGHTLDLCVANTVVLG